LRSGWLAQATDDHACRLVTGSDSLTSIAVHLGLLDCESEVEAPAELQDALIALGRRLLTAGVRGAAATRPDHTDSEEACPAHPSP
jgi:hypothetical protein